MGDLSLPCSKTGQGHPRVIIYTTFEELEALMLHTKIQDPRPFGSGEEDFLRIWLFMAMSVILVM